jgi:hypothetical protein
MTRHYPALGTLRFNELNPRVNSWRTADPTTEAESQLQVAINPYLLLVTGNGSVGQLQISFRIRKCKMLHVDSSAIGDEKEAHPIAREAQTQIRAAIDRSEMTLRWIAEGGNDKTVATVIDAEERLVREIGQQIVAIAYQLDNLVMEVRTITGDGTGPAA